MAPNIRLRVLPQILPNDGRDVEIRNNGTFIQWRYSSDHLGDYEWQNLIAISALIGPAGPAIELRTDGTYIQYRIVGSGEDGWIDVIPIDDLKGDQGDQGPQGDAATIEIGAVNTLPPGAAATVVNTGTSGAAVFDFGLPLALRDHINARDYGAAGDGTTDDYASLQAAIAAANTQRRRLYIPKGTYIISAGLKLPSHSYVFGDGFDTIIKIADSATYEVTALTNEHNTGSYLTNTGDEDITIERLTVDGNGRRASTGRSGTCVQFSTVAHGVIRDVKAINGRLHCIDICAGNTNTGPDEGYEVPGSTVTSYTPGPSFDILIENCITNDSVNDDGLTTHYSHHITIINHTAVMSDGVAPGTTSHAIEIDDGSYEVSIYGGYAKGWVVGLQIKGHITNPAARNVYVSGFVAEGNTYNYDIQHGTQTGRSATAYGVTLDGCVSIRPVITLGQSAVFALSCRDYGALNIRNFQVIGDPATFDTLGGVVQLQDGLHDSNFENIYFKDVNRPINGALRVVSSTGENVRLKNIVAEDCYGWVAYVSNTTTGIVIENVHATLTNITTPIAGVLLVAAGVTTHVNTYISNITANGGYLAAVVDAAVPSYIAMPLGRHRISVSETQWVHSDSDGGVTPGGIHRMQKIGYLGGDQNLAAGEGTAYGFGYKVQAGVEYEVAYVAAVKISGTDSNTGFSLNFGTRDNADAGTQATTRLQIIATVLQALTDNTFSLGTAALRFASGYFQKVYFGSGVPFLTSNAGTPEAAVAAPIGSLCADVTNGVIYVKKTGTGNTGWKLVTQAA